MRRQRCGRGALVSGSKRMRCTRQSWCMMGGTLSKLARKKLVASLMALPCVPDLAGRAAMVMSAGSSFCRRPRGG